MNVSFNGCGLLLNCGILTMNGGLVEFVDGTDVKFGGAVGGMVPNKPVVGIVPSKGTIGDVIFTDKDGEVLKVDMFIVTIKGGNVGPAGDGTAGGITGARLTDGIIGGALYGGIIGANGLTGGRVKLKEGMVEPTS